MTNLATIAAAVTNHIGGVELEPDQLALWANEAQRDLSLDFAITKTFEFSNVKPGQAYALPDDLIDILSASSEYRLIPGGNISFKAEGTVSIVYRAFAAPFSGVDGTQECELPNAVHHLIPLFVASRYWLTEAEGDGEEMRQSAAYMQDYLVGKARVLGNLAYLNGGKANAWTVI